MIILEKINSLNIILASNSPRRKALLENTGIKFNIATTQEVDENIPSTISGSEAAQYLAVKKNNAYRNKFNEDTVIITADTTVLLDGNILNKPQNTKEAEYMLNLISGNKHEVLTGVCISAFGKEYTFTEASKVEFEHLEPEEIKYYIEKYKPCDKAGAYGIQEWIGHIAVKKLEGSFYNIVGFPINRVYQTLKIIANSNHNY